MAAPFVDPDSPELAERVEALVALAHERLDAVADPEKAAPMAAYMKTEMPFYGVQKAGRVKISKALKAALEPRGHEEYAAAVRGLWAEQWREMKYLAVAYARSFPEYIDALSLPLYEQMIREGAWWDFVDEISIHLVGKALRSEPDQLWPVMDAWIEDEDFWIQRAAIICQISFKGDTDSVRLFEYCDGLLHVREFFIRKAIGWALREYSKTAPEAVIDFVEGAEDRISGLSRREALKRIRAKK